MTNSDSVVAATYRTAFPTRFAGLSDQEVLGVAKQLDPKFTQRYQAAAGPVFTPPDNADFNGPATSDAGTLTANGSTSARVTTPASQAGLDVGSPSVLRGLAQESELANYALGKVPVVGPVLNAVGNYGKGVVSNEAQGAADIGKMLGPVAGGIANGLTDVSGAVIPQNALGVGLMGSQALAGTLEGMAAKLTPVELGGPLATGQTADFLAQAGKVATGIHPDDIAEMIADPSILKGTETPADVGADMNAWGQKMGVKTGAMANETVPGVTTSAKPGPLLADHADDVLARLGDIQQRAATRAQYLGKFQNYFDNADQIASTVYPDEPGLVPAGQTPSGTTSASKADEIRKFAKEGIDKMTSEGQQDLQDLITAKGNLGTLAQAPSFENPIQAKANMLLQRRLSEVSDALDNTAESLRPGSSDELADLNERYHNAKLREAVQSVLPVNKNGSPSVLGAKAGIAGAAGTGAAIGAGLGGPLGAGVGAVSGGAAGLMAQSPAMLARLIRTAAFLKDAGVSVPSNAFDLASKVADQGLSVGALNNSVNSEDR